MPPNADDAFRRFLERATAEPETSVDVAPFADPLLRTRPHDPNDEAVLIPLPVHTQPSPWVRRVLPYAAAVAVLVGGTAVVWSDHGGRVRTVPGATGPTATGTTTSTLAVRTTTPTSVLAPVANPPITVPLTTAASVAQPAADPAPTSTPAAPNGSSTTVADTTISSTDPPVPSTDPPATIPAVTPVSSTTSLPSSSVLDVRFGVLPVVANGVTIVPTVGPSLRVDQVGTGSIEAATGGGWRFLPGGQQRDDYAVITKIGADVQTLVPATGKAVATFVPLVSMTGRSVPTGRNIHTWFEVVSEEGPDHPVLGISVQVDPEIGPYLAATIQGVPVEHTLTAAEQTEFDAGRTVQLGAQWTKSEGQLTLNGRVIATVALPGPAIVWKPTARLSIGGSATWGGGYFSIHDDVYRSFMITG